MTGVTILQLKDQNTGETKNFSSLELCISSNNVIQYQSNLDKTLFDTLVEEKEGLYYYTKDYEKVLNNLLYKKYQKIPSITLYTLGLALVYGLFIYILYSNNLLNSLSFVLSVFILVQAFFLIFNLIEKIIYKNFMYLTTYNLIVTDIFTRNLYLQILAKER